MRFTKVVVMSALGFLAWLGTAVGGEPSARLRGDALSADCNWLAVGVSRFNLHYPLLGGLSGWSQGVPKVRGMVGVIYVFDLQTRTLRKAVSIKAPIRMAEDTDFSIRPRWLPGNRLIFSLRGCPKEDQNCKDLQFYSASAAGGVSEMTEWPEVSAQESDGYQRCTSMLTYAENKTFVSVGPRGGPWTPVLAFDGKNLVPVSR
jgi:uncharacterized membrane protein YuzA (DUF378 family)